MVAIRTRQRNLDLNLDLEIILKKFVKDEDFYRESLFYLDKETGVGEDDEFGNLFGSGYGIKNFDEDSIIGFRRRILWMDDGVEDPDIKEQSISQKGYGYGQDNYKPGFDFWYSEDFSRDI